jgi:hypothetical protein
LSVGSPASLQRLGLLLRSLHMPAHAERVLRIRTPLVIHETVDDEVVIVNLESGTYYSLVGTGALVWNALEQTATAGEVTNHLRAAFANSADEIAESVTAFLSELLREGLIVATEPDDPPSSARPATAKLTEPIATPALFTTPVLEKFSDMQELILLDPVHEVEEDKGWPHPKPPRRETR